MGLGKDNVGQFMNNYVGVELSPGLSANEFHRVRILMHRTDDTITRYMTAPSMNMYGDTFPEIKDLTKASLAVY